MHFVGKSVGLFRRVLVIVFLVTFPITFLIRVLIGVQRFLQLLEFGRFDVRFGDGFDSLGALFGIGLRFFVLGFDQLLAERGYFLFGKVRGMRIRDHRRPCFGIETVEIVSDIFFGVRRSGGIIRRTGESFGPQIRAGSFVLFRTHCRRSSEERSRQARGNFFIRERARSGRHRRSLSTERRMRSRRRRGTGRSALLENGERFARQNHRLEIRGRRFIRFRFARPGVRRRSVLGLRQIAPGRPAISSAASYLAAGPSPAFVASALPAAIAKAAAPAIISRRERRMLRAMHRGRGLNAAFGGNRMACGGNLKRLACKRRDDGNCVHMLNGRGVFTRLKMLRRRRRYRFRDTDHGRGNHAAIGRRRRKHFAAPRFRLAELGLDRSNVVVFLEMFQKIADVQEGVAIEANVNEGRLHTRKDSGDPALVKASN